MKSYSENQIELIKLKAIQDYLLDHGSNDEVINKAIREVNNKILESQKERNK